MNNYVITKHIKKKINKGPYVSKDSFQYEPYPFKIKNPIIVPIVDIKNVAKIKNKLTNPDNTATLKKLLANKPALL